MAFGNSFDQEQVNFNRARKVWREVVEQFPAGGVISNISDWVSAGKVPAGTPCKWDMTNKTIVAYTDSAIKAADDVTTLGINGYTLYDTIVKDANTIGTNTVVYHGEIYSYMLNADTLAKVQGLSTTPMIVFVQ